MTVDRIRVISDGKKGRSFDVSLLSYVNVGWWGGGTRDVTRPAWMVYVGSEDQVRPFTANAQTGRKIQVTEKNPGSLYKGATFEFLKSAGHVFVPQKLGDGMTAVTVYHPSFFRLDPGMVDPSGIEFLVMPSAQWIQSHHTKFQNEDEILAHLHKMGVKNAPAGYNLRDMIPLASLFCGYLDRRTRTPLVADPRFQVQLLIRCFTAQAAFFANTDRGYSYDTKWGIASKDVLMAHNQGLANILFVLGFKCDHDSFASLVAEEVTRYFQTI